MAKAITAANFEQEVLKAEDVYKRQGDIRFY